MNLKDLRVEGLYELMDELDEILHDLDFNARPMGYRFGIRRMRTYLDHVASGLRMVQGGRYEPHCIMDIHFHNRKTDNFNISDYERDNNQTMP